MTLVGLISFGILLAAFVFQLFRRGRNIRTLFFLSVLAVLFYYLYLAYAQYLAWISGGPLTQFLVPPHRSIFYVFGYHFTRFLIYYFASFLAAVLILFSAKRLNRRAGGIFFENEEPYLGALSIFLLGNPDWNYAWVYYIGALLAVAVALSLIKGHKAWRRERLSLRFLWLPVAILVALARIVI